MLLGVVGCWVLLNDVGCCWMLLDIVGWCQILLGVALQAVCFMKGRKKGRKEGRKEEMFKHT